MPCQNKYCIRLRKKCNFFPTTFLLTALLAAIGFGGIHPLQVQAETFNTLNSQVVIEAEQYTRLGGTIGGAWFANTAVAGYQGDGYVQSASDDPATLTYADDIIRTEYDINFTTTGTYYVHLRTYAEDASQNGFFATLDGEPVDYGHDDATYIYVQKFEDNPQWWWYTDGGGAGQRGLPVSFQVTTTGTKTLAIFRRDKSSRIDRIWLTRSQSTPQSTDTLNLPDPSGFIADEICQDQVDNDGDGLIDCADSDCAADDACQAGDGTLLSTGFDTGADGFTYQDDTFNATANPAYAAGDYAATGGAAGGGLHITLGGQDFASVTGISGGWQRTFTLDQAGVVQVALDYRLIFPGAYESDECAQALVAVDGALQSVGGNPYLASFCGGLGDQDTGWQSATIQVALAAGTHTLTVGAYNSKKTGALEITEAYFDNIAITTDTQTATESDCTDGVDNDGDGLTDCNDADCDGDAACAELTESDCTDGIDNDGDGLTDCDDDECSSNAECQETGDTTVLTTGFDTGADDFTYQDDTFNATANPAYAAGDYAATGGAAGGGLHITLGGQDFASVTGISGGWQRTFTLDQAGVVQIELDYRLIFPGAYESDECAQALVAVDGAVQSAGGTPYLASFCGGLGDQDTGWQSATLQVALSAGNHTLTVGAYNSKKTGALEITEAYFDNIAITTDTQTATESDCTDGVDNDGDGLTDCDDDDCSSDAACQETGDTTVLTTGFDTGADGFTYQDDTFNATANPAYASGDYAATGGAAGGGLHITLGGQDFASVTGISGGWQRTFTLDQAGVVQVALDYRLIFPGAYESDECAQALVAVDGALQSVGGNPYLASFCGGLGDQDTGWQSATIQVTLSAGTHTLTVGAYNSKKTGALEITEAYFDNIAITTDTQTATESDCTDGVDNDGDGLTDCNDADCDGDAACAELTESDCTDGIDNDGDGLTDCDDDECSSNAACQETGDTTVLTTGFDTGADGFTYQDDTFNATANPTYASGDYAATGGAAGGGLHITLGGQDFASVTGISGGWQRTFTLDQAGVVQVELDYRLIFPGAYESDECAQALVAVDGAVQSTGGTPYLAGFCGGLGDQDTGWQSATLQVALSAGTHTLTVGAYNSKKTGALEITEAYFDNVTITLKDVELVFLQNFDDGDTTPWTIVDDAGRSSQWLSANGRFTQTIERVDGYVESYPTGSYVYATSGMQWDDAAVHATLKSTADPSGTRDTLGLMFRYQDADNYYRLTISRMQGFARLEKRSQGVFTTLAHDGRGFEVGTDLQCEIIVSGSTILAYLNGAPLFSAVDADHGTGTIALLTQGPAEFDNVYVTALDDSPRIVLETPAAHTVAVTNTFGAPYDLDVSAIGLNIPAGYGVRFTLDGDTANAILAFNAPYAGTFSTVAPGNHTVGVAIVNAANALLNAPEGLDKDLNAGVAVGGHYLLAVGDSITNGVRDDILEDNAAANLKNVSRGYSPILTTLLGNAMAATEPVIVFNEGIGGATSADGRNRMASVLVDRHPDSQVVILLFGSNDAASTIPTLSGMDCTEADFENNVAQCVGTFKANLREMLLTVQSEGQTPVLMKVPYRADASQLYNTLIAEYNLAIDQLTAAHGLVVTPPDLYTHFYINPDELSLDGLHPNGSGYSSMADLVFEALTDSPLFE